MPSQPVESIGQSQSIAYPTTCNPHSCRWRPYSNSNEFERNAVVILILIFCGLVCTLSLIAAIRCFLHGHQLSQQHLQHEELRKTSDDVEAVMAAPTLRMIYSTSTSTGMRGTDCVICLSEFEEGDEIEVLERCKHGFHGKCIRNWWYTYHYTCPTCRSTYLP